MTTTYKEGMPNLTDLQEKLVEILTGLCYSRLRTFNMIQSSDASLKSDRLLNLIVIFTLNQIVTLPEIKEGQSVDLETRIHNSIASFQVQEALTVGTSEHDLLQYELKELCYLFLAKVDQRELDYFFDNLCAEEGEKVHYEGGHNRVFKAMVVIAVLLKTSDIYNDLVDAIGAQSKKPKRGGNE